MKINNIVNQEFIDNIYHSGLSEIETLSATNLKSFLNILQTDIKTYQKIFDIKYGAFLRSNNIIKLVKSLPTSYPQNKEDSQAKSMAKTIEKQRYQNKKRATNEFIGCLIAGQQLLNKIRTLLTNQTIETYFTIKTREGVYRLPASQKLQYSYVLSAYGGLTKSNPFSLAYQLDAQILKEQGFLKEENKISDTIIYETIMNIKNPYLQWLSQQTGRKYTPYFNSKDAEIYNLMLQNGIETKEQAETYLTMDKYAFLRDKMGGGGGYRTSSLKMGDVGLEQEKFIAGRQGTVNAMRISAIQNNFEELRKALSAKSGTEIKEQLKKIFTEQERLLNVEDKIAIQANREAQAAIDDLFKDFKI